jgi:hypothetical protein
MKLTEAMFDTLYNGKAFNLVCYAAYLDMDLQQVGKRDLQVGARIDWVTITLEPSTEDRGQVEMVQIYDAATGGNLLFQWDFRYHQQGHLIKKGDVMKLDYALV